MINTTFNATQTIKFLHNNKSKQMKTFEVKYIMHAQTTEQGQIAVDDLSQEANKQDTWRIDLLYQVSLNSFAEKLQGVPYHISMETTLAIA